jgi:hypothetical protein
MELIHQSKSITASTLTMVCVQFDGGKLPGARNLWRYTLCFANSWDLAGIFSSSSAKLRKYQPSICRKSLCLRVILLTLWWKLPQKMHAHLVEKIP